MARRQSEMVGSNEPKRCPGCEKFKPRSDFHVNRGQPDGCALHCKACRAEYMRHYAKSLSKTKVRDWTLKQRYGLEHGAYDRMLEAQSGLCGLCGDKQARVVDHCHRTGAVRMLLCNSCNLGLGLFRDDPSLLQAAIDYIATAV